MTSRNEVRIDIEVEGGARAERQFDRAEKGVRDLGRSTRGLINPLLGAGLVSGILGGGLLGLALSSGSASNGLIRMQGALEGLASTIFRSLEPGIDFAATQFEKLPVAAQLGVLGVATILGVVLAKLIVTAATGIAAAVTGFVAAGISGPLVAGVISAVASTFAAIGAAVGPLLAVIFSVTGLAVAAIVVGLASLAFIAWDLIFNDGRLLKRFEEWLSGIGWIEAILRWDEEVLTPFFTQAWEHVIEILNEYFILPFLTAWEAVRDFFKGDWTKFFTQTIPGIFTRAWAETINILNKYFILPFRKNWRRFRDFFKNSFVPFFTEVIPNAFRDGWDAVVKFMGSSRESLASIWETIRVEAIGALNGIIEAMNAFIQQVGTLPIPKVTVTIKYITVGDLRIPYPTFSVTTRPLSSIVSLPQIPTIPLGTGQPVGRGGGGNIPLEDPRNFGTTNNYYSLTAQDFARAVEAVVNAPGAQARAVGAS